MEPSFSLNEQTDDSLLGFQEREEMLLKQQKSNSMDVLNMSSLTLEEESSSVVDVLPKMSSKVGRSLLLLKYFCVLFWTNVPPCFSLCWSTPLPSMILWWRFQR